MVHLNSSDGPDDLNAGIRRRAELASGVAKEINEEKEARHPDAERTHGEVVKVTTDLAELLDDVGAATIGVSSAVKNVEGAVPQWRTRSRRCATR